LSIGKFSYCIVLIWNKHTEVPTITINYNYYYYNYYNIYNYIIDEYTNLWYFFMDERWTHIPIILLSKSLFWRQINYYVSPKRKCLHILELMYINYKYKSIGGQRLSAIPTTVRFKHADFNHLISADSSPIICASNCLHEWVGMAIFIVFDLLKNLEKVARQTIRNSITWVGNNTYWYRSANIQLQVFFLGDFY